MWSMIGMVNLRNWLDIPEAIANSSAHFSLGNPQIREPLFPSYQFHVEMEVRKYALKYHFFSKQVTLLSVSFSLFQPTMLLRRMGDFVLDFCKANSKTPRLRPNLCRGALCASEQTCAHRNPHGYALTCVGARCARPSKPAPTAIPTATRKG